MGESFTPEAVAAGAVAATSDRAGTGTSGRAALVVDGTPVALDIVDGRVVAPVPVDEAAVRVPVSGAQFAAILDGSASMAQSFMRGDVKPEGATGPLLALIELFEDAEFRQRLAGHLA